MPHPVTSPASWRFILIVPVLLLGAVLSANIASARASEQTTPQPPTTVVPTPTCGPAWEIVSSPNGTTSSILHSVAIVSTSDIWAVGLFGDGARTYTLTEHWDGSSWNIVPSPVVGYLLFEGGLLNCILCILLFVYYFCFHLHHAPRCARQVR